MRIQAARGAVLENAVSGRSLCRGCNQRIAKETPRFGRTPDLLSNRTEWFHPGCAARLPTADATQLAELLERWEPRLPAADAQIAQQRKAYAATAPEAHVIVDAAQNNDWDTATSQLRALWWATRDPAVASVLAQVTNVEIAAEPVPAAPDGTWMAHHARTSARWAGHHILLRTRGTKSETDRALHQACSEPPDPRWVDLVLPWLEAPPWSNAFWMWSTILTLLDRLADPRALAAARTVAELPLGVLESRIGGISAREVRRWAEARAANGYPAFTRPPIQLTDADRAVLEGLQAPLARREQGVESERRVSNELLHAAAAGDDGALLVYADRLVAAGDLRGELIQLELAGRQRTPAQRARRKALKRRWRELVGELAPALLRDGLTFRRGLVIGAAATVPREADLERLVNSPDWAALERLELRRDAQGRIAPQLVFAPQARRLRFLQLPDCAALAEVLEQEAVQPGITEIELHAAWDDEDFGRFALDASALPGLRRILAPRKWGRASRVPAGVELVVG